MKNETELLFEEEINYSDEDYEYLEEQIFNYKSSKYRKKKNKKEKSTRRYISSFKLKQKERREERISFHFQTKDNRCDTILLNTTQQIENDELNITIRNSFNEFYQDLNNGYFNECRIPIDTLKDIFSRDINSNDYETLLLLDEDNVKNTLTSNKLLNFKERRIMERECDLICSICLEEFKWNEMIRILPCNHEFHSECIDYWLLEKSNKCPLDSIEF
eukprot:gene4785-8371_t